MEYSGFFNGDYKYGQEEFSRYYANIYANGVSFDDNSNMTLEVTKEGSQLKVAPGFAIINGFYLYNKDAKIINIVKPTVGERTDRVVIRLDSTVGSSSINIELKTGSDKKEPDLNRDNNIYELSLAKVSIDKDGNINIYDERSANELCGGIRPRSVAAYEEMIKRFEVDFNHWLNEKQNKGREIFIQSDMPKESVSGSIWIELLAI